MGKQEARDVGTGLSVISAAGVITPEPVTTAMGAGGLIGQGVGFIAIGLWDVFSSVSSNPKSAMVAEVPPTRFALVGGQGAAITSVNNSITAAGEMINSSRLLYCSLERLRGALEKKNALHAKLQRAAATSFLERLEGAVALYTACLENIDFYIQDTAFAQLSVDVAGVIELRDQIVAQGQFPEYEQFVFEQMGATEAELNAAIKEVSLATGQFLPQTPLRGSEVFGQLACALRKVDIRELLPDFFHEERSICIDRQEIQVVAES